jgi:hypothetical protein
MERYGCWAPAPDAGTARAVARAAVRLEGMNSAAERAIAKSKLRYAMMRGPKILAGRLNGIALMQYHFAGRDELNLAV